MDNDQINQLLDKYEDEMIKPGSFQESIYEAIRKLIISQAALEIVLIEKGFVTEGEFRDVKALFAADVDQMQAMYKERRKGGA